MVAPPIPLLLVELDELADMPPIPPLLVELPHSHAP
jgi:hypothetical protein